MPQQHGAGMLAAARIRRADRATLERWTDRVLTASTLEEVLD